MSANNITQDMVNAWWTSGQVGPDPRGPAPNTYGYNYDYQLQSKIDRCILKTNKTEVVEFMRKLEEDNF